VARLKGQAELVLYSEDLTILLYSQRSMLFTMKWSCRGTPNVIWYLLKTR